METLLCLPLFIVLVSLGLKAMHQSLLQAARAELVYECALCLSELRSLTKCRSSITKKLNLLGKQTEKLHVEIQKKNWICQQGLHKHRISREHLRRASL